MGVKSPYPNDEELHARIDRGMTNQAPNDEQLDRILELRKVCKAANHAIADLCPAGRDRSIALTHGEDMLMRAVRSIVLEELEEEEGSTGAG